ncbi:MAG: 30S ribosomal protein S20 [Acidimicrobiia bacterium]
MANIKSQIKRNRQNTRANERNRAVRSELRTWTKRTVEAAEAGDAAEATRLLSTTQKRIDMAVTKGVLHKATAARRKSRLMARVHSILA